MAGELPSGNPQPGGGDGPFTNLSAGPLTPTVVILINQLRTSPPPPPPRP